MINDENTDRPVFASLVGEMKHLRTLCTTCVIHVTRSQNCVSDFLAKYARAESGTVVWLGSGLPEVVDHCNSDCNIATT